MLKVLAPRDWQLPRVALHPLFGFVFLIAVKIAPVAGARLHGQLGAGVLPSIAYQGLKYVLVGS